MDNRNDNQKKDSFTYTYSAKQQEEVKRIRQRYLPPEEDKMERLRQLDRSATQKGTAAALVFGIIGVLLLGLGMCCTMVWTEKLFIPGVIVGVVGIVLLSIAYPIYNRVTQKEREKIAPEILRLTDELMK